MGKEGTKIAELDVNKLISELNRAYCDEWLAFYLYWYMAQTVTGFGYEDMSEFLQKTAMDEFEHAGELAERITSLGGQPVSDISMLARNANVPYPNPPEKPNDYSQTIDIVLKSEAGAIDVYQRIAQMTMGKDHVTHQLVQHILSEEIGHEDRFENLKTETTRQIPVMA